MHSEKNLLSALHQVQDIFCIASADFSIISVIFLLLPLKPRGTSVSVTQFKYALGV
jgi:hypothetical protein